MECNKFSINNEKINIKAKELIDRLAATHNLSVSEYKFLIEHQNQELADYAAGLADKVRREIYGNEIYVRGLIEIGNYCTNDCYYCGIRKSNNNCDRYQLTKKQIMECCQEGYELGFRTFVLQGGEGIVKVDDVCQLVKEIKEKHSDVAVTLSLGECSKEDYLKMYEAGADRYLLRHETANREHYEKLHPKEMSFDNRMECLQNLKEIGYQVGCGFMVGSPYQTTECLAEDLKFIEEFSPHMCGIGPFISQKDTEFKDQPSGTMEQTVYLLSLIRLIKNNILLPATTALGTIHPLGREMGIKAGANVVMPNLSPVSERKKYALYDNKICTGDESAQCKQCLSGRMASIGYKIVTDRGDMKSL